MITSPDDIIESARAGRISWRRNGNGYSYYFAGQLVTKPVQRLVSAGRLKRDGDTGWTGTGYVVATS